MPHVPPPVVALAAGTAQHLLAGDRRPGPLRAAVAAAVAAGSAYLLVGSTQRFASHHTTVDPLRPARASALVTDGPNRITRNPMYLGMAGLLASHAVARGGPVLALPVAAFVAIIDRVQVRPEEAALRGQFGAEYDAYCRTVRRWL
ncbi:MULTISPECIES: methyltransferase family protein [Nocardioides]|uniref:Methyltransferase family protein n=1 Tax=Nocardioides vastitatis TaxID=2568655 RepID=A0ABW0ZE92_9ACTN|nr:isoprenylcysteine carboxylmethyltransferase family protein [Nocardioides sp.]THI96937.1 isoprenylcysteine carboxylmethyltransferase family protein [Nocardioides sp.]